MFGCREALAPPGCLRRFSEADDMKKKPAALSREMSEMLAYYLAQAQRTSAPYERRVPPDRRRVRLTRRRRPVTLQ
jgi:hypothetical protein